MDFDREVLQLAEALFGPDEIETKVWFSPDAPDAVFAEAPVKVIHTATGLECESAAYASQIRNKA